LCSYILPGSGNLVSPLIRLKVTNDDRILINELKLKVVGGKMAVLKRDLYLKELF
jgi:hypothetical protein